jgi:hypothetical protein
MRSDMTDQSESVGARLRDAHKVRAAVRYLADEAQAHLGGLLDKIDEIDNDIARLADEDLQRCGGNGRG